MKHYKCVVNLKDFPPKKIVHEVWGWCPIVAPGIMASGFLVN